MQDAVTNIITTSRNAWKVKRHILNWRKTCAKCGLLKDNESFSTLKNGLAHSWCKMCVRQRSRENRAGQLKRR